MPEDTGPERIGGAAFPSFETKAPEPETTDYDLAHPFTWTQFKFKVGLRDDDPMSVYQDAQAQYFKDHVAPQIGTPEQAMPYFQEFMQRTARPQKYSKGAELFMQGATQIGKTALATMGALNVPATALTSGLAGLVSEEDRQKYLQAGRNVGEMITSLSETLSRRQMEAQQRYARETVPGVEVPVTHFVGDVIGSQPAFKMLGAIVPKWGAYSVDKIGDVVSVKPSYLTAAARGGVMLGAYNSMVAEPGQKLSEGVHGFVAGATLGVLERVAQGAADKVGAPFLNWLKWRNEPRVSRDVTPEAPLQIGEFRVSSNTAKQNKDLVEILRKMNPDEKVRLWQEYENELGNLRTAPEAMTVVDRAVARRNGGTILWLANGQKMVMPYGATGEAVDSFVKQVIDSKQIVSHIEGSSAALTRYYGALGKLFQPEAVTTLDARNEKEAQLAEERLRALGLDARADGTQVILQPSAVEKIKGEQPQQAGTVSAAPGPMEPLPPMPEPTGQVERRKASRLITTAEGVQTTLGMPAQEALDKGYAKAVEGGWELTRSGYEYGKQQVALSQEAVRPTETSMQDAGFTPEQLQEIQQMEKKVEEPPPMLSAAVESGTSTIEEMPVPLEVGKSPEGYPDVIYQGNMLGLEQYKIKGLNANFSVAPGEDLDTKYRETMDRFKNAKPGIVQRYEMLKKQYDEGLIPKSQTTAIQATLRQLEQAIRTGLPDWAHIVEPEPPKPVPQVFGVTPEESRAYSQTITVEGYNLTEQQKAQLAASQVSRESQLRSLEAYGTTGAAVEAEAIEPLKEFLSPNKQHLLELTQSGVRVHSITDEGAVPEFEAMAVGKTPEDFAEMLKMHGEVMAAFSTGAVKKVVMPGGQIFTFARGAKLPAGIAGVQHETIPGKLSQIAIQPGEPGETMLHEIGHLLHAQLPVLQRSIQHADQAILPSDAGTFSQLLETPSPTGEPLRESWNDIVRGLMEAHPMLYTNVKDTNEEALVRLWTGFKRAETQVGQNQIMELIKMDKDLAHVLELARETGKWAFDLVTMGTSIDPLSYSATQSYYDKWMQSYLTGLKARTDPSWTLQRYGEMLLDTPLVKVGQDGRWMTVNEDGDFTVYDSFKDLAKQFDERLQDAVHYPELTSALEKELKMYGWNQPGALPEGPTGPPRSGIIGPSFMAGGKGITRREFMRGKRPEQEVDVGLTPVTAFVRNSRDWFNSVQQQTNLPVFDNIYLPFDSGQMKLERVLSDAYKPLYDMLRRTTREKRVAYRAWLQAKGVDAKAEVSHKNNFTKDDLANVAELRQDYNDFFDTFKIGDSAPFIEDYVPRMEQAEFMRQAKNHAKANEVDPFREQMLPKEVDFFAKHERVKDEALEASQETDAVLQLMQYIRIGAREQHLGPVWDEAKATWRTLPAALKTPVAKYMQHMYGEPDFVYQSLTNWMDKYLAKIPGFEKMGLSKDSMRKFVLLQYSSSLGFRPALAVRDAMQSFLTAYPHLGERWFGHGFTKALTGDGWRLAEKYDATIPDNIAPVPEGGEPVDVPGLLQKGLYFTHVGNNFGRVVTFNGAFDRAKVAIAQFRKDRNLDNFLQDSGAEILQEGLARDAFTKALDKDMSIEDAAGLLSRYIVEATQWPIRKGNAPQLIRSQMGRTLGMYGQWPEQFIEYMIRGMSRGSVSHRVAWIGRWYAINQVMQTFFQSMGADVSRWIWTSPADYNGSVWTSTMGDLLRTVGGSSDLEAKMAQHRLMQLPFQFVPGYQQMRSIARALDSDNPLLALLGFRSTKEPKFMGKEVTGPTPGPEGFHSRLGTFLESLPEKVPSAHLANVLQSGVTSKNELEATGILKWLAAQSKSVSKKDVLDFFKENQISFNVIEKGASLANEPDRREYDEANANRIVTHDSIIDQLERITHGPFEEYNNLRDSMEMGQLDEHLEDLQKRTKATPEAIARLREDLVKMDQLTAQIDRLERFRGDSAAQFSGSTLNLPGGNPGTYREMLLQLNKPVTYTEGHWQEPNVLLHTRFDTVERGGEKTLRLQEVQSDWLQTGREKGFIHSNIYVDKLRQQGFTLKPESGDRWRIYYTDASGNTKPYAGAGEQTTSGVPAVVKAKDEQTAAMLYYTQHISGQELEEVPNAPYKETSEWLTLAARKMLRYAVENGFKRISWTTAAQQSERYGNFIEQVKVVRAPEDKLTPYSGFVEPVIQLSIGGNSRQVPKFRLLELVGNNEELADKIWNTPAGETVKLDKPIYQEGMQEAYDVMLVNIFRKLLGVKPEKKEAPELYTHSPLGMKGREPERYKHRTDMWEVKIPKAVEEKVKKEGVPIASNIRPAEEGVA